MLGTIHSDVCGKIETKSLGGAEYFVTFIDDKSRYTWVYVLKHKHEVLEKFKEWRSKVEKSTGFKIKTFRTDNGGEYKSKELEDYLKKEGYLSYLKDFGLKLWRQQYTFETEAQQQQ